MYNVQFIYNLVIYSPLLWRGWGRLFLWRGRGGYSSSSGVSFSCSFWNTI